MAGLKHQEMPLLHPTAFALGVSRLLKHFAISSVSSAGLTGRAQIRGNRYFRKMNTEKAMQEANNCSSWDFGSMRLERQLSWKIEMQETQGGYCEGFICREKG